MTNVCLWSNRNNLGKICLKKTIKFSVAALLIILTASCGESWTCQTKGKSMYSISASGKIGSADKGCSCDEIKSFELKTFGRVDEDALKKDFGC